MMFRSIALSCSLLGFLANSAAMAMDLKEGDTRSTPSQKQTRVADNRDSASTSAAASSSAPKGGVAAPSRELQPFMKAFPPPVGKLIA